MWVAPALCQRSACARAMCASWRERRRNSEIWSGNVVFTATEAGGPKIVEEARNRVVLEFGFATPMVLRDAMAWRALIEGKPFIRSGADPDALHAL
jgi:uncharacterized protein (DUF1697 family)